MGEDGVGVVVKAIVDDFFDGFADTGFDELTEFVDGEVFDLHGVGGGWGRSRVLPDLLKCGDLYGLEVGRVFSAIDL